MPIVESRLKTGTLTFETTARSPQATDVQLVPSVAEEGERLEVLSGDVIEPDEVTTWALTFTNVQDFTDPEGLVEWARANAGEVVAFTFVPNGDAGPSYAGTVKVRPILIGGPVAARLTSTNTWPIKSGPNPTYAP